MRDNLKETAIQGARWGTIENLSSLGINFIVAFILARWFLTPREYGLIGYLTIFIALSTSLIDNGFSSAIIRKPNPSREDLSTTFITNFTISILCFVVLYTCAPLISRFFAEPQLLLLLRVLSCVLIFNALSIIQRVLIIKAIDFKRLTVCTVVSSLISGIVGVGMALKGYGVWSLVGQQISKQLTNAIMLWILGHWRIYLKFSLKSFKELFGYGCNIMLTGLLDTFFKNIYYPVIGKTYSAATLGQYSRADQFSNVTSNNLSQIVQRVSFTVLSKTQESEERLRNAFSTTIKVTMFVAFLAGFCLSAISKPLIIGLIGEKWEEAAQILSVVCLAGMFYPGHALNQNILQIKGKMRLYLTLEILKKVLLAISIVIALVAQSMSLLLWGMVVVAVIVYCINAYFCGRHINYPLHSQLADILSPFITSLAVAIISAIITYSAIALFNLLGWNDITWTNLVATALGGIVALGALLIYFKVHKSKEAEELKNLLFVWRQRK